MLSAVRLHHLLPFSAGLLLAGCSTLPAPPVANRGPEVIATLEDPELDEISGVARSLRTDGLLWMHNDSGDSARFFAVDLTGRRRGTVELTNATARDWEEMASFDLDGEPWLLLADVGDNEAVRHDLALYLLPEPDAADLHPDRPLRLAAPVVLHLAYEDGPRDCEGIVVHAPSRQILLISKRTAPPVLYSLPLTLPIASNAPDQRLIARRGPPLTGIVPPSAAERVLPGRLGEYRSWVTAFTLSPDDRTAAVLTYGNIWVYRRTGDATWAEALAGAPTRLPVSGMSQAEGLCFSADGRDLIVTTEGVNAPIQRYRTY